jgi:hypothetical protein
MTALLTVADETWGDPTEKIEQELDTFADAKAEVCFNINQSLKIMRKSGCVNVRFWTVADNGDHFAVAVEWHKPNDSCIYTSVMHARRKVIGS